MRFAELLTRRSFSFSIAGLLVPSLTAQQNPGDRGVKLPPRSGAGRRFALIIGNDAYLKAPALSNCGHDADDVAAQLTLFGFETAKVLDAKVAAAKSAVSSFAARLQPGDVALFFYSGHGVQAQGENYIVPVDFDPAGGEERLDAGCLRATAVRDQMERSGARLNILILDACRNNPFRPGAPVKGMALMEPGLGTCIALATGPGNTASDNAAERNGLFTKHFLRQLRQSRQDLDATFKQVKDLVYEESGGKQRPWVFSDLIGEFYFSAASGPVSPGPRPQPAPPTQSQLPPAGQGSGAAQYLDSGARDYLAGRYADAAAGFERAIQIDPENAFAYNALGSARARLKQWSLALGQFSRAIALKEDYAAAYFNRGVTYYNSSIHDDLALQDFSWAIDREPFDPLALDMRGKTYLRLRDNANALADFNRALELDPSNAAALAGRGGVFYRQGRYPDAVKELTESLAIRPDAAAFDARSQAYRAMHRSAEADADAARADQLRGRR